MIRSIKKLFSGIESYQDKRENDDNWNLISPEIKGQKNLLDVACDAGFYSIKVASQGCFVLGFDILENSLKKARRRAKQKKMNNIIFAKMALDPVNVNILPNFDTILCLSVFHHFVRLYGEEAAKKMLIDLFLKANNKLLLQIPSKIGKYKKGFSIDFKGDESLIRNYILNVFEKVENCNVKYLGKKIEKPPSEKYRYLYLVEKITIEL